MAGSQDFDNKDVIAEFRANHGIVGGLFAGLPLLLLHHVGRRSGVARITPLSYQQIDGGWAVFGTNGGSTTDPDWCRNVLANPDTVVEIGSERYQVKASLAQAGDRARIWEKEKVAMPVFVEAEAEAGREIPVIVLRPANQGKV